MIFYMVIFLLALDPFVYIWVKKRGVKKNNCWPLSGYFILYGYLKNRKG